VVHVFKTISGRNRDVNLVTVWWSSAPNAAPYVRQQPPLGFGFALMIAGEAPLSSPIIPLTSMRNYGTIPLLTPSRAFARATNYGTAPINMCRSSI
jgi:hypothetical protein